MFALPSLRAATAAILLAAPALLLGQPAKRYPSEAFAPSSQLRQVSISPDGQFLAWIGRDVNDEQVIFMKNLATGKVATINPGYTFEFGMAGIGSYHWLSDERIAVQALIEERFGAGVFAINRDGSQPKGLSGIYTPRREDMRLTRTAGGFNWMPAVFFLDEADSEGREVFLEDPFPKRRPYPDVYRVNTLTGTWRRSVENAHEVLSWGADYNGVVRIGLKLEGTEHKFVYRSSGDEPFRPLDVDRWLRGNVGTFGFLPDNRTIYFSNLNRQQRWELRTVDIQNPTESKLIHAEANFDLLNPEHTPSFAGHDLDTVVISRTTKDIVGLRYVEDGPRMKWLVPRFDQIQAAVDEALPKGTFNLIISWDRSETLFVVLAFSDRDPGAFYLLDTKTGKLSLLARRHEGLDPAEMARTFPVRFKARDGLQIPAYLTLPKGRGQKNLPLIALIHGGPFVRDVWGFDSEVQFLANRGYAVLQINFRGSPGYGQDFHLAGKDQIGRKIQDDIEDGVRWIIAQGVADPKRIGLMGASYGGYSTMFGLVRNPDLYRVGINVMGIVDWVQMFRDLRTSESGRLRLPFWQERIGGAANDEALLASISPLNEIEKLRAPVLVIHGQEDGIVDVKQANRLIDRLRELNKEHESLILSQEGHGWAREETRKKVFARLDAFLARHLPAD